ncbi:glucosaminidase domain-containing protein [Chryseosolibacter indicus]|uniref:Glucosaminidase domain-containing protein n=1 Tax=Chryseosolibacter indicus TaxID=2782351 RepID=A0ABS5VL96_9BACT|nr:glucosaminidase domain-containing protein [Chryseosolibacter indicus]MBT1702223.1 glucosaminidase domain-containing protein [Chryseosolibacter indicus]
MRFRRTAVIMFLSFTLLTVLLLSCNRAEHYVVVADTVEVKSLHDIISLKDTLVKPVIYNKVTGLGELPVTKAKQKFIATILPAVLIAKHEVETLRSKLIKLKEKRVWQKEDSMMYQQAKRRYNGKNIDDVINRMIVLPNSIVLAQAATETGWGQSRFFEEANNIFGIWSVKENEERIAARKTRNNKTIYVRSYPNLLQSIRDYFSVLSRSNAYKSLRKSCSETSDPFLLVKHLSNYSERKNKYTRDLKKIIEQNNLTMYDKYRIDPQFLIAE